MKKLFSVILSCLISLFTIGQKSQDPLYVPGQFYVKLKDNAFVEKTTKSSSAVVITEELAFLNKFSTFNVLNANQPFYFTKDKELKKVYKIILQDSNQSVLFISAIKNDPSVEYIEPVPLNKVIYTPNDPSVGSLYHLNNIKAYDAWNITQGGSDIVVAIVDDAVQVNHPDLQANCLPGRDVADNDSDPNPPNTSFSHGTHVAGIVGAVTNNNIGIAAIGFNKAKILPVKSSNSSGYITHGYEGIAWAVANGAKIINMSWGGGGSSITDQAVINNAYNNGVVLIAAAGNDGTTSKLYPAGYDNVISVVSTTSTDAKSYFSSYGNWVDICAPGSSIYSTVPFSSYDTYSGTSMASPLTAGAFAFIWSTKPTLTNTELIALMKSSADNIDAMNPSYVGLLGSGRVNVLRALSCTDISSSILPAGPISLCNSQSVTLTATPVSEATYQWKKDGVNIGANSNSLVVNSAGVYTLLISKSNCIFATNTVTVAMQPSTVAISYNSSSPVICGDSLLLSSPNIEGMHFQWKKDNLNIGTNKNTYYANESGSYQVVLTNNLNSTCPILTSNIVSVTGLSYAISPITPVVICEGQTFTLSVPNYPDALYQWKKGNLFVGNNSHQLIVTEQDNYSVLVLTTACGNKSSNVKQVSVIPTNIELTTNISPVVCGTTLVIISAPVIPNGIYQWYKDSVSIGSNTSNYTATSAGNYYVTISSSNGCINSSNILEITEFSTAIPLSPANPIVCSGTPVNLSVPAIVGATYQWKRDNSFVGSNLNTLQATISGSYSCSVQSNGCSRVSTVSNVSVLPLNATVSTNKSTLICPGETIILSTISLVGVDYQWKRNGIDVGNNASTHSTTLDGSYTVSLSGSSCPVVTSNPTVVTILNNTLAITPINQNLICLGDSLTLTGNAINGATYKWYNGTSLIAGATSLSYKAKVSGNYTLKATILNCEYLSNVVPLVVNNLQAPLPAAINAEICEGLSLTQGSGLKVNVVNCPTENQQTFNYSGPQVGYDAGYKSGIDPSVTISGLPTSLSKVTVKIKWLKKGGGYENSCSTPHDGGSPYNSETEFKLQSPSGTIITLVSQKYRGNYAGIVETEFSDTGIEIITGSQQSTGTFKPTDFLSTFNGTDPNGIWKLLPKDWGGGDPLCVSEFSVSITSGSSVPGGTPPVIKWYNSVLTETSLFTGNEYLPSTSSLSDGNYTYYAQAGCAFTCNSPKIPVILTVKEGSPVAPVIIAQRNGVNQISPVSVCNNETILLSGSGCPSNAIVYWSTNVSSDYINVIAGASQSYTAKCFQISHACNSSSANSNSIEVVSQPVNMNMVSPIVNGTNQLFFANYMKGSSLINPVSNITYKGSNSVTLEPGFFIDGKLSNNFKAEIGPCSQ